MLTERTGEAASVLPFALSDRWIVTVENERHFVKVRHRRRWYAVARRKGHEDRRHWCASRADAIGIAEIMRDGFREMAQLERFTAAYYGASEWQRARFTNGLIPCAASNDPASPWKLASEAIEMRAGIGRPADKRASHALPRLTLGAAWEAG